MHPSPATSCSLGESCGSADRISVVHLAVGLSAAIYANFFTNHYMVDLRWPLAACVLLLFRRTQVNFIVTHKVRRMPLRFHFF